MRDIVSPMPQGSGAIIVHRYLETSLPRYRVLPYSPLLEWCPPLLINKRVENIDLVHTTPDYACFVGSRRVPLIVTFHNYLLDPSMLKYSTRLQRLHYRTDLRLWTRCALRRARAVTAVSRFTAQLVAKDMGFEGEVYVIPNGVDTQCFQPAMPRRRRGSLRVLVSGNMTTRKGIQWLRPIAERLDPGIRILCPSGLRSRTREWEVSNIESLGQVKWQDMPKIYQFSDVLLMPTVREGMSMAVLEAMACGLPVVATDCSSLPEQVHHGRGGYLCRLGNVAQFAEALNKLNREPALRQEMGEYNRYRVESEFTLNLMVARYRRVFEEALDW